MSRISYVLFLDTPRAGGERGHRWLVPSCAPLPTDAVLSDQSRKAMSDAPIAGMVRVKRQVDQVVHGGLRRGEEIIAVSSLPPIGDASAATIKRMLGNFLESFDPDAIAWENTKGLVIQTELLDDLYFGIRSILEKEEQWIPSPPPVGPRRRRFPWAVLAIAILALMFLPRTCRDTEESSKSTDPRWAAYLDLRKDLSVKGQDIDDARFFWEVVVGEVWSGGEFREEDITRNEARVVRFLECPDPRHWYRDDMMEGSDESAELRAILKAVPEMETSAPSLLDAKFRDALNESINRLVSGERSVLGGSERDMLDRQSSRIREIPENDKLPWMTPADAKRARILLETIRDLSQELPPEYRRIETWEDFFSNDVLAPLASGSQRSGDPVIEYVWSLVQPLDQWHRKHGEL